MIRDFKYIIKKVIIGVLIVLVLSFIRTCEVNAESQVLSPSTLSLVKYYGNNYVIGSDRNCHNNVCWWNIDASNANVTSVRWTASQTLTYSNVNVAVFNIGMYHNGLYADETEITDVSIGDYSCFYIKNESMYYNPDNGLLDEEFKGYNITAMCPLGGTINYSNGSKTANVTFNNTGSAFSKYSISNITFTKDDKLVQMLTYLGTINSAINTTNSNLDVVKQDLTYLLQAQNNTSYWAEVNSGKLESIKSLLQSQTTSIQNSIASASQSEIDAANQNTQDTIDSQKVCREYGKNSLKDDNKLLASDGSINSNNNYGISKYIKIDKNTKIKVEVANQGWTYACFYDENKTKISCIDQRPAISPVNTILTIPQNANYFRFSINKQLEVPIYEICTSGNQANNDAINDVNDTLNNSNVSIDTLPSDSVDMGPISSLVTLPITALNNIVNAFSGTCTPFNIGSLFGTELVFPCINIESFIGSFLWNTIDIIITGIFIFSIRQRFVDLFYKLVTLKDIGLKGGF